MSILKDLLALKPVAENQDEWEAAHAAQAEEHFSRHFHGEAERSPVLARSDEFQVEVDGDDVLLLDGEQVVRVTMPRDIWMDLCKQSLDAE